MEQQDDRHAPWTVPSYLSVDGDCLQRYLHIQWRGFCAATGEWKWGAGAGFGCSTLWENKEDIRRIAKKRASSKGSEKLAEIYGKPHHDECRKNGIKRENLQWAAAVHGEKSHPHIHVVFWDKSVRVKNPFTPPQITNAIRKQMIKDTFWLCVTV